MDQRKKFGNAAEQLAGDYLRQQGYRIVARQWRRLPLGEIDIVARERDTLVFVEVKARATVRHGLPEESVTYRKRAKISRLIELFRQQYNVLGSPFRFDVIAIEWGGARPVLRHLKSVGIDA